MGKSTMLTVVPKDKAVSLVQSGALVNFNNLPNLNDEVLSTIKDFFAEKVGYANLPLACLRQVKDSSGNLVLTKDFMNYLPVNSKESVLFILEMPSDLIVSIDYSVLLDISAAMTDASGDSDAIQLFKEDLIDQLRLGVTESRDDMISFIPFLDKGRCKFFAAFNQNFEPDSSLDIPGMSKLSLHELTAFID